MGSKRRRSGSATRLRTLEMSEFSFACTLPWAARGATRAQRGSSRCLLSTTMLNRFIRDAISRVIRWLRSDGRVDKPSDSECLSLANLPKSTQIYPKPKKTSFESMPWQHYQTSSIIPQSQRMCMNLLTLYTAFGSLGRLLGIGVRWVPNFKSQFPRPGGQNITLVQLRRSDSEVFCS